MSDFQIGDRVKFNRDYLFASRGDTGTVVKLEGECTRVQLDKNPELTSAPYNHRLEKIETPVLNFSAGSEPATGEQYLNRAVEWLSDNANDAYDMLVGDVLAVAQFLHSIAETNKQ